MEMDLSYKDKLSIFRVKELKDVLTSLGLSKQGKKQDLVDRILMTMSGEQVPGMLARKEAVAKLIDDTYRKMHLSSAKSDLESKGKVVSDSKKAVSDSNSVKPKEPEGSYQMEKIRCPCGSSLQDSLIQCADSRCSIWQHIACVIIPEKSTDGVVPVPPETFYCELCRLSRADPFWVTIAHPLYPTKLTTSNFQSDGTNPVQSIEKSFQLTRADKDLLAKPEYDVQAWCILLNDKVSFRLHWPQYADLQVNGVPVRVINRPGSQLLGANGRDDGAVITPCTKDGVNKISLTGCDARLFCMGVRIARRRTVQQILSLIPKECEGEQFQDALSRVRHCVGGGAATKNADSDSDLEVVADSIMVKLCCPMSGLRMKVAGRFKPCVHMGCFDLDVFVEMNQRTRKWQCPICLKNYSLENVIIDPYFNRITSKMRTCGEDVTEIEVKPDGSWRVKPVNERKCLGDLTHWHSPDGSVCMQTDNEAISKFEVNKIVKQECTSEGHTGLKLGIKKNTNGIWEVSKPGESSVDRRQDNLKNNGHIITSSSITGAGRVGEDPSVNQEGGINFNFSTNNAIELDSVSPNIDPVYEFADQIQSAPIGDADVIILSDSEEENELIVSSGPIYKSNVSNAGFAFDVPAQGITDSFPENSGPGPEGGSYLENFDNNEGEFGLPLPSADQEGPMFQLFGSEADISGTVNCYSLNADTAPGSTSVLPDSSLHNSTTSINDSLVDYPSVFSSDDPTLQTFISSRPSIAAAQTGLSNQPNMSSGTSTEDWISLRIGSCQGGACDEPPAVTGSYPQKRLRSKEGDLALLTNTASLLSDTNDNGSLNPPTNGSPSANTSRKESGPFTFPRQRRSVRPPRLYLSIDSDSE